MRVLVSIDVKGIFIKILQFLDVPVIGFRTLLDVFFVVPRVLPETGLDRRCGRRSERAVESADETQMPLLQPKLRTKLPLPKIFHGFAYHSSAEVPLSTLGWGSKTMIRNFRVNNLSLLLSRILDTQKPRVSLEGTQRELLLFIDHTTCGEIPITCPVLQVQTHFQICSRCNPKVTCFTCNI